MRYQDCVEAAQAADEWSDDEAVWPAPGDAHINPATGLATDYLNHFIEAIMLLEMIAGYPDCRADFLAWQPVSYREHFAASGFKSRDRAIAAYDAAEPDARESLDALAGTMTAVLEAVRGAMVSTMPQELAGVLATRAAASLRPLVSRAGAVINGVGGGWAPAGPQSAVDTLLKQ